MDDESDVTRKTVAYRWRWTRHRRHRCRRPSEDSCYVGRCGQVLHRCACCSASHRSPSRPPAVDRREDTKKIGDLPLSAARSRTKTGGPDCFDVGTWNERGSGDLTVPTPQLDLERERFLTPQLDLERDRFGGSWNERLEERF